MTIDKLDQLNDIHMDVLREIGNIGSGNAATSLSTLMNVPINMSVPTVRIVNIEDALTALGGPENVVVSILAKLYGDIDGIMMFIIEQDFAKTVLSSLLGQDASCGQLTEMEMSAIAEVGNIMIGSYSCSISTLSQLNIMISVPATSVDMVGAVLSVPAIEMASVSDKLILIQDSFVNMDSQTTANMLFVPSMDSLNRLMQALGIEL